MINQESTMSEQEQTSLEKAKYWLDSFKNINLRGFQSQLQDAVDHAKEQEANPDLPECNRAQYAEESVELAAIVTKLKLAQDHIDAARVAFITTFGDTADPDWWLFSDNLLE